MNTIGARYLMGLLGTLMCGHIALARPVARVLQVSGKAEVVSQDDKSREAVVYGSLYSNDKIRLQPKSTVVIGFRADGRLEKVVAGDVARVVTIDKSTLNPRDGVSLIAVKKSQSRRVATSIKELPSIPVGGVTILRGPPPETPGLRLAPISDSALLDSTPEFSWPKLEGATSYEISLYLRKDRIWESRTDKIKTTVPAEQALKPGRRYRWKVIAETPTGPQPVAEAEFTVAFAEDAEGLSEWAASKEPALMALAAASYEQAGLLAEAIATYEQLIAITPKAAAVHAALSDLYDRAGRGQDAAQSRKQASSLGFQFKKREKKAASESKDQTSQRMKKQTQLAMAAVLQGQEVDPHRVAEVLCWAAKLPKSEAALQRDAQVLATRTLWDPLIIRAEQRAVASTDDLVQAEQDLRDSIERLSELLLDEGVPVHWIAMGRLNLAAFQYRWQRFASTRETLDTLSVHMSNREIRQGDQARYWNLQGLLASEDSQFALAFDHHTKALQLRKAANLQIDEAESLNNLGKLLLELGDSEAARKRLEQAQAIYQQYVEHPDYYQIANAATLTSVNLSKALEVTRDFDASIALLEAVVSQRKNTTRQEFIDCVSYNNLGLVLYQAGQFQRSRILLDTSQQLASELFGEAHIRTLESVVNLGWLNLTEGNWSAAEECFRQALISLSESEPEHHRIAEIKAYLARVASQSLNRTEAITLIRSALDARRKYLAKTLGSALSERDRLAFVQKLRVHTESIAWPGVLDTYLELAPELQIGAAQQYRHVLNWKGILHEPAAHATKDSSSHRQLQQLRAEWSSIRQQLRQDFNAGVALDPELERSADNLERRLRQLQQTATGDSSSLDDVVTALPPHSVLFDVIELRQYLPRTQGQTVQDNRVYVGFLVEPTGQVSRLDLGDAAEIDAAIESFVQNVSTRRPYSRQSRRLDRLLAEPLREKLATVELLIISADGWLHRVPWGALPGSETDFWVEELAFATVSSAQSLVRKHDHSGPAIPSWLVIGGVDYGAKDPTEDAPTRWQPLASSAPEARHIDQLLRRRFTTSQQGALITGADATKEKIVSLLAGRKYVHIATHGSFIDRQNDAFDIQGLSAQLDSFLVCASANQLEHAFQAYLTAEEIGNLNLQETEVVTLSACETGLGHISAGQGLIGLVGALERAGAGAVVSALWKVDDTATAQLMETFYAQLLKDEGVSSATAVRQAQLTLLTHADGQYEHPFYWAPWVLSANRLN